MRLVSAKINSYKHPCINELVFITYAMCSTFVSASPLLDEEPVQKVIAYCIPWINIEIAGTVNLSIWVLVVSFTSALFYLLFSATSSNQ